MMRLMQPGAGLFPVFRPAQLPQPRAGVASAGRRAARVTLPQATLPCLAGPALDAGQRALGTG